MNCKLIIAHHPILFKPIKSLTGKNYVERILIEAIKNEIIIYSIHTSLDQLPDGVSQSMTDALGLQNVKPLKMRAADMRQLVVYIPVDFVESVEQAIHKAGAGKIGNYSETGFRIQGVGSFTRNDNSNPSIGKANEKTWVDEVRFETIFPAYQQKEIIKAMKEAHPYEEVAYSIHLIEGVNTDLGFGSIGQLEHSLSSVAFLELVAERFNTKCIRYTHVNKPISKVAICGGSGSFLLEEAIRSGADAFISADFTYHRFFDAEGKIMIADIGHYESEQFVAKRLKQKLEEKFPTFALQISCINTNPVKYF